jgi:hypothetical protein
MLLSLKVTIYTSVSGTKTRKISWVKREERNQMKVIRFFCKNKFRSFSTSLKITVKVDHVISCYGSFATEG